MNNYLPPIPRNVVPIGSPQVNTKTATATNGTSHSYAQDHWTRYGALKGVEDAKNTLIEDILSRYDAVVRQCNTLVEQQNATAGRDPSVNNSKMYQELQEATAFVSHLQNLMNGSPFITVVIDGNSLLFDEAFVRDGEKGGRRAAVVLKNELTDWVPRSVKHAPSDFKIMVKVCANFKYLAGTYMRAGAIDTPSMFGDFSRGFNTLFDIVDIGNGDVNSKIVDHLKLFVNDYHCHQVVFGGTSEMLDVNVQDEQLRERVALLQSVPSETQYPFKTVCLPGIFLANKLTMGIANITPRTGTPASGSSVGNGHLPVLPFHTRTNSVASSVTTAETSNAKTWAKLAQDVAKLPLTNIAPRVVEQPTRRHNRKGQRIDPPFDYDMEALQRVKKIKMCNMHYLHPDGCKWPASKCNHRHDYKPTPAELKLLKSVSRETACHHGVGCEDDICVYGHRCLFPAATEGSMRGLYCMLGDKCRFPREMHGIKDSAPARATNMSLR